ncbi:uncharacterized protein LOC18110284 [Populus trichocarpa]|uniref:uncharacterized protein LOC18110284 n=1 Tax=Populus trichocarpa TaxID=3694 RepID=UPI002279BC5C|nr:uncharacterized protein LOC18110284 [Populus trichocarpa]
MATSFSEATLYTAPAPGRDVVLLRNPSDRGTPVTASTKCETGTAITDSASVFISFNTTSTCAESTEWRFEENGGFMTIGEGKTKTEFRIINKGWRFGNGYKLLAMFFSDFGFGTGYVGVDYSD